MRSDDGLVGQAEEEQEIFPQLGRARVEPITKEKERNVRVFSFTLGKKWTGSSGVAAEVF